MADAQSLRNQAQDLRLKAEGARRAGVDATHDATRYSQGDNIASAQNAQTQAAQREQEAASYEEQALQLEQQAIGMEQQAAQIDQQISDLQQRKRTLLGQ